jgi:site-specific DNA recombinase
MLVYLYARVSTAAQAAQGYSLPTQIEACKKKAMALGATENNIIQFIDDGYSGAKLDRPQLTKLRKAIRTAPPEIVICYAPDRLSRDVAYQLIIVKEITKVKAKPIFVSMEYENSPQGRLLFNMVSVLAEYERENIKERTLRGKRGKATAGKVVTNVKPFGYDYDKEASMYIPNKDSKLIKYIFTEVADDSPLFTICKNLNLRGIPSPKNKHWNVNTIRQIIDNQLYIGRLIQFKNSNTPITSNVPTAIIDDTLWETAHEIMKRRKLFIANNTKGTYLLSGLLYCADCGRKMIVCPQAEHYIKSENKYVKHIYYRCKSRSMSARYPGMKNDLSCHNRTIETKTLDEYFWDMLLELIKNPDKIQKMLKNDNITDNTVIIKKYNDQLATMINKRKKLLAWYNDNYISATEMDDQLAIIKKQVDITNNQLAELNNISNKVININDKVDRFINVINTTDNRVDAVRKTIRRVDFLRKDLTRSRWVKLDMDVKIFFK